MAALRSLLVEDVVFFSGVLQMREQQNFFSINHVEIFGQWCIVPLLVLYIHYLDLFFISNSLQQ